MGKLIIAAGPPASGKSTWAEVWRQGSDGSGRQRVVIEEGETISLIGRAHGYLDQGYDVLITISTEHEVEALNFAGDPDA